MRPRSRKPVPTSPDLRGGGGKGRGRICFSPRSTLDKLPNSIIFLLRLGRVTCDHEEEANCGRATVAWALAVGDPILSLELGKGSIKLVAVLHVSAEMSAKVTVRHEAARAWMVCTISSQNFGNSKYSSMYFLRPPSAASNETRDHLKAHSISA